MDQHTESGWKHDPTARREKCEMNFRNNLTAFSWKVLPRVRADQLHERLANA